jgi:hypothetical protein
MATVQCGLSFVRTFATKAKSSKKSSASTTLANLPSGWEALNYFKDGKPPELKVGEVLVFFANDCKLWKRMTKNILSGCLLSSLVEQRWKIL